MMGRRAALAGLLALGGCAPLVQLAGSPDDGFAGPAIVEGPKPAIVAHDGARLGLTIWPAATPEPWAVIVGLHGMNDYAEAFALAGIAGAVRFRNSLKSSGDALFILCSVAIGLSAGIGAVELAAVISVASTLPTLGKMGAPQPSRFLYRPRR